MRTKLKKSLSVLLALVMLVGLLPTMAFATGETHPNNVTVNNGVQLSGAAFFKNGDAVNGTLTGTTAEYNAKYDSSTGILELKDYQGGTIATTGSTGKTTTIKLSGTNTITDSRFGITAFGGDSVVITSDENATLNITINGLSTYDQAIAGISAYIYGNPTGSVTVGGKVNLEINVTAASSSAMESAVGIYAANGITIQDDAKVTVTCKNTTNSSSSNVGLKTEHGTNQNITFNTTGNISVDVSESNGYSYALRSNSYTMTKADLVTLKWSTGTAGTAGGPLYSGDNAFADTSWAINKNNTAKVATYKYGTPFSVEVFGAQPDRNSGKYVAGETVTLKAHSASVSAFGFKKWASNDIPAIDNNTSSTVTFTMLAKNVNVVAYYNIFETEPLFTRKDNISGNITYKLKGTTAPSSVAWYNVNGNKVETTWGTALEHTESIGTYRTPNGTYYLEFTINGIVYRSEPIEVDYSDSTTPSATVSDVTVDGRTGAAITSTDVTVTLTNDKFAGTLSGDWITNLPAGLTQTVTRTGDTTAKITISGASTVASTDALAITIPADQLVTSTSDLTVTSNADAKFDIKTSIAVPDANTGLTYDGNEKIGVDEGTGYALTGHKKTNAGSYTAQATLQAGYVWNNGTNDVKNISWSIANAEQTAPTGLTGVKPTTSDGNGKITGTTAAMEYKPKSSGSWADCSADETAVEPGDYFVRYKEKTNYNAGANAEVNVPVYAAPATYTVTITPGSHMTKTAESGEANQTVSSAITDVVYTADEGYYFPTDYPETTVSGISVTRNSYTQITVSGTPTADASITLTAPTAKTAETTPSATFTATDADKGTLSGVDATMKYSVDGGSNWQDVTGTNMEITGVTAANDVKVKKPAANETKLDSDVQTIDVTQADKPTGVGKTDCTTSSSNDGKLTNVTTAMEYGKTGAGWTPVPADGMIANLTHGTYVVRIKANGTVLASENEILEIGIASAPLTYSISLDKTGTHTFGARTVGYGAVTPETVTVTNTGTGATGELTVALGGTNAGSFTLSTNSISSIAAGGTRTFTVMPNTGLAAGTHTATVTVSGSSITSQSFNVSFTVNAPTIPVTGVTLNKTSTTITVGNTETLTATVNPSDASNNTLTWTSSNTSVATVNNGVVTAVAKGSATITVKTEDGNHTATCVVNVKSKSGGGIVVVPTYSIDTAKTENGSISVSPKSAAKGTTVTITATPDKGYELDTLTALDKDGKEIKLTEKNGKYTFGMPASKVTVKASFKKLAIVNPFVDVKNGDYFYDAVLWAVNKGITVGTSDTTFSPDDSCTRGQIVTFLWRAAGSPEAKSAATFSDVSADAYYAKAVAWAVENGITVGTSDTTFSPDDVCTRAQAVTFLSRALKGKAAAGNTFSDVAADSYYAEAVAWAVANDITMGTSTTTFSPDDVCTRGQIVTFLFRAMAE